MASEFPPPQEPHKRRFFAARWIALFIASFLLHLLAIGWAGGKIAMPSWKQEEKPVITTMLIAPATPAVPASPPTPDKSIAPSPAKAQVAPRHKRSDVPAPPAAPTADISPLDTSASTSPAGIEVPGTSVESFVETPPASSSTATPAPSVTTAPDQAPALPEKGRRYRTDSPPSAELKYDVEALRDGQVMNGVGKIIWHRDANSYRIDGEAGAFFLSLLSFHSDGSLDEFGVSPVLYSEKRFMKSQTNTHFQRERNIISFSATTISYPRNGGEQDRASIVWQLASIGRADSAQFFPEADIPVFVAGSREGEIWHMRIIGKEEIETGIGKITAWHIVRNPRTGTHDQMVDIWLAPEREWYPVQIRFTETNGGYLVMSISKIHAE